MNRFKKSQNGETIIEVLIAIMILSAILAGAFAISNRSQKTVQAGQERSQAQSLASEQASLIRELSITTSSELTSLTANTQLFCMRVGSAVIADKATDPLKCRRDQSGAQADDGLYDITVTPKTGPGGNVNTFIIKVEWDSLINNSKSTVEVLYGT